MSRDSQRPDRAFDGPIAANRSCSSSFIEQTLLSDKENFKLLHILGSASRDDVSCFSIPRHHDSQPTSALWSNRALPLWQTTAARRQSWMTLLFGSLGHGATLDFLPFRAIGSLARRRSTKWRLHTKNIYQIHTTSHQCSQGERSELRATHIALTVGDRRDSVQNPKRAGSSSSAWRSIEAPFFLTDTTNNVLLPKQQVTAHSPTLGWANY